MHSEEKAFLTAEWRSLVMLNYEVEPSLLGPLVPEGTELDEWQGKHLVSVVGFRFLKTRVLGLAVPFHQDFEEVNLRFYVRRKSGEGWRRGVVFIKEMVPRMAIAVIARVCYNEPYVALPMTHHVEMRDDHVARAEYRWRVRGRENRVAVETNGGPHALTEGTEEEFVTEHYWGYNRQRNGRTMEYRVDHPRWRVQAAARCELVCSVAELYGAPFVPYLQSPRSAFLAEGSEVTVFRGRALEAP